MDGLRGRLRRRFPQGFEFPDFRAITNACTNAENATHHTNPDVTRGETVEA
jgi:hypothetical protein